MKRIAVCIFASAMFFSPLCHSQAVENSADINYGADVDEIERLKNDMNNMVFVDEEKIKMLKSFKATKLQILFKLIFA